MKLLNSGNAKTKKGEKMGWKTYGIHLAPSKLSGFNTCQFATAGCAAACLNTAGRGIMSNVQKARIAKTLFFFKNKEGFLAELRKEIRTAIRSCKKQGLKPCFRLNLTSDLPFHKFGILEEFPDVQFYDYTKDYKRALQYLAGELPANYQLTFSRAETKESQEQAAHLLSLGMNVAAVFRKSLPETWSGFKVIDGDNTDLRFLDPQGVIVGLVEKGKAKQDASGFVISHA
jgi:hypothetical protein